jgi:cytoskeletal protein CcmA (bactofilin family)
MKQKLLIGKLGRMMLVGMLGLAGVAPLRAQDDPNEKKAEAISVERPAEPTTPPAESDDEDSRDRRGGGKDVVMVGNDFLLKEDEVAADVVVVSGNATIKGRVSGDLVVVAGSAKVLGEVDGDLAVVLGSATLGPEAEVRREIRAQRSAARRPSCPRWGFSPTSNGSRPIRSTA